MHTRESVEAAVIETLMEVQKLCGHAPENISPNTIPLFHLSCFDSQVGVEATNMLASKLKLELPPQGRAANLFVSADGTRASKVSEIVSAVLTITQ